MDNNPSRSSFQAHRERNLALIAQFNKKGVSLTDLRSIELHFWAWGHQEAVQLANALYKRGYLLLRLGPANKPDEVVRWNIEAGTKLSIERVVDDAFVTEIIALAERFGAEYDGWGTLV